MEETLLNMLKTFGLAMLPVGELRGAIPIAVLRFGMNEWLAFGCAVLGNLVPVPFLILFIRRIFNWLRRHVRFLDGLVTRMEERAKKKSELVKKSEFWGLVLLVAIPLPGTGAWTGAMVAAMMDMRLKRAFPAIALGVVAAGLIMLIVASVVGMAFWA